MMWFLSLFLGLIIAWLILKYTQPVSYYQSTLTTTDLTQMDDPLVSVGLAQHKETPSIMDTVNKPVPAYSPAPSPDPNFTPGPSPGPPQSNMMSPVSSPEGFASPSPVPSPGASQMMSSSPMPSSPSSRKMTNIPSPSPSA